MFSSFSKWSSVCLLLVSLSHQILAQNQVARTVDGLGSVQGYLEYLPSDYHTTDQLYPAIIFLHGHGERGDGSPTSLELVKKHGPPKHIKNGHKMCFEANGKTECFIVLSPQQSNSQHGWNGDVIPFTDFALSNYRIDPDRVYLTGLSMGGDGCWDGMRSDKNVPNRFAATSPIAGKGMSSEGCTAGQREITTWVFHSEADNQTGINSALRAINGYKECHPQSLPPKTTIYQTASHGRTWQNAYTTDNSLESVNLYQWFLLQTRNQSETPNQTPTVALSADQTITLPESTVSLTGNATDVDGTIELYSWSQISGPSSATIESPTNSNTIISGLIAGVYEFSLQAADDDGASASATTMVTVNEAPNQAPMASAGADLSIMLPESSVVLNGSASDPDGSIVSYNWSQMQGPSTATIESPNASSTEITTLSEGVYEFKLEVTDDDGATANDLVVVTTVEAPNQPPVANAGADLIVTLPENAIVLNGSATDADGTITAYRWQQTQGPSNATIDSPNSTSTVISDMIQGVYEFSVEVTDDDGATDTDLVLVTMLEAPNEDPLANAGSDLTVTLPENSVILSGSASDTDGTIVSFNWSQITGPSVAKIESPNTSLTTISELNEGVYEFNLEVTDDDGSTASDLVVVTVHMEQMTPIIEPETNSSYLEITSINNGGDLLSLHYTPQKGNIVATEGGNNAISFMVKPISGTPNWDKMELRLRVGYQTRYVLLGNYIVADADWQQVTIPLTDFAHDPQRWEAGASNFQFKMRSGFGSVVFGLDEITYTGGSTPFVWYGDDYTESGEPEYTSETSNLYISQRVVEPIDDPATNNYLEMTTMNAGGKSLILYYTSEKSNAVRLPVTESGNDKLTFRLKLINGIPNWQSMQVVISASFQNRSVVLGNYITNVTSDWTTIEIPLVDFGHNAERLEQGVSNFQLKMLSGFGDVVFAIDDIIYSGGTTPFVWYGESYETTGKAETTIEAPEFYISNRSSVINGRFLELASPDTQVDEMKLAVLYDMQGRKLRSAQLLTTSYNAVKEALKITEQGFYIIRIHDQSGIKATKIYVK